MRTIRDISLIALAVAAMLAGGFWAEAGKENADAST